MSEPDSNRRLPVAILAGGLATRMRPLTTRIPKALIHVAGKPFVDHQLALLQRNGYRDVVLCVGHLGDMLRHHVGSGERFGLNVGYVDDGPTLLGTGGALRKAAPLLGEAFVVLYGDSYLPMDYARVEVAFRNCGRPALMTVYRNRDRYDRSNVVLRDGVVALYDKEHPTAEMEYIDYGMSVIRASVLDGYPERFDLASVFTALSMADTLAGFEVEQRFFEIGSPSGLAEAENYLRSH